MKCKPDSEISKYRRQNGVKRHKSICEYTSVIIANESEDSNGYIKITNNILFEITSLLVTPPDKINIIVYDFIGLTRIIKDIIALEKTLIDKPININFAIENLENPENIITKNEAINAPKKPKIE
jgi:hypothetical protein